MPSVIDGLRSAQVVACVYPFFENSVTLAPSRYIFAVPLALSNVKA